MQKQIVNSAGSERWMMMSVPISVAFMAKLSFDEVLFAEPERRIDSMSLLVPTRWTKHTRIEETHAEAAWLPTRSADG